MFWFKNKLGMTDSLIISLSCIIINSHWEYETSALIIQNYVEIVGRGMEKAEGTCHVNNKSRKVLR
jgi:hypothetical protein